MNKPTVADIGKASVDTLSQSSHASSNAMQDLTNAYQELAARNAKNVRDSLQAIAKVKTPAEFFSVQQSLLKDYLEAAVSDSKHIAELTAAVFTAAFEPVKKQFEAQTS
jgi:phasin family protein